METEFSRALPTLQRVLGLSIAEYEPRDWGELGISSQDFWDRFFAGDPEGMQLETTVRNLRGAAGVLIGHKGSGKSTLLKHLQHDSNTHQRASEQAAVIIYDLRGRWVNIESKLKWRDPSMAGRMRGEPRQIDERSFVPSVLEDCRDSLEGEIERLYPNASWAPAFKRSLEKKPLLARALWELKVHLDKRIILVYDNIDQIPYEGLMKSLLDLASYLYAYKEGGEILGVRSILAVRHGNFGRLNISNTYTDWVDRILFLTAEEENGERYRPEYTFALSSEHVHDVIDRRLRFAEDIVDGEICLFMRAVNDAISAYSNLDANMWRLSNRSYKIFSEVLILFSRYLIEGKRVKTEHVRGMINGRNYGALRKWVVEWLYRDPNAQQYRLLSEEGACDADCCNVKRMAVAYLYNRYVRNPGGVEVATIGDVYRELRKIGYSEGVVAEALYELYVDGSIRGRMINFVLDFILEDCGQLLTKAAQRGKVYLMPMGIVNYENIILNFELYNSVMNAIHGEIGMHDAAGVVRAFERVAAFVESLSGKHIAYIQEMRAPFKASREKFEAFFSRVFCKGGRYFLERVIEAHQEELNRYYSYGRGTGGLYYDVSISKGDYLRLQRRYAEIARRVRDEMPILEPVSVRP